MSEISAVLQISILDTPISGTLYLGKFQKMNFSFCTCRGKNSPIFKGEEESSVYHLAREWFMEQFDGFVKVVKLEGNKELEEIKKFQQLKLNFS